MTVLHSGTTKKYSANWDKVFQKTKAAVAKSTGKKTAEKKPSKGKK